MKKMNMNKPLEEFVCDCCGQIIKNPSEGELQFIEVESSNDSEIYISKEFKIIHKNEFSPNGNCQIFKNIMGVRDNPLEMCLNADFGMGMLLSLIDSSENDTVLVDSSYFELLRRLKIPYYDEAKQYWNEAMEDGFFNELNQLDTYSISKLKSLIFNYSKK
jgi:hypothetical protein